MFFETSNAFVYSGWNAVESSNKYFLGCRIFFLCVFGHLEIKREILGGREDSVLFYKMMKKA
jgi:hypothetical protein